MAKSSSLVSHIEAFVDSSCSSAHQTASVSAITSLVKNHVVTPEALVKEMELYLTTPDHLIRARGVLLLAEILMLLVSEPLESSAIRSLVGFFTSKLADWQAIHGALIGCLALLKRKSSVRMVTGSDARVLLQTLLSTVHVQTLAVKDRKLCYEILLCLFDAFPEAAKTQGEELSYQIREVIDQEKDPRCLLLTFHLVETLMQLFPDPSDPVASSAEDFFDILGSYFPIDFTHPNDDFDVKRDELARALMQAFCSTPYFEPFAIPLLLEKLSSSLHLAKLDSLKYLNNCILHYGTNRMVKHAETIWSSLRDVIFHHLPQEPLFSSTPEYVGDLESRDKQIANEALRCLKTAILHLDGPKTDAFISLMLEDDKIQMIFTSLIHERSYSGISEERLNQLRALGSIISVASNASSSCCSRIFQKFFLRMIEILGISANDLDAFVMDEKTLSKRLTFGALYLCIELLTSCKDMCEASQGSSQKLTSLEDSWHYILKNSSRLLINVLGSALVASDAVEASEINDPGCSFYSVKGLLVLATFPGGHLPIAKDLFENILTILMSVITDRSEDTVLWKSALNALVKIGSFIEKDQDTQREISYNKIVVERIILLLAIDESNISLTQTLEAISKIGFSGLRYTSRIIRVLEEAIYSNFLKACVEGDDKAAELLVSLLECYSKQVLSWCHTSGDIEGVMNFTLNIWSLIENAPTLKMCSSMQVILDSAMMTMKLAVGACTEEYQLLIVQKAYNVLSSTEFFSKELILPDSSKLEGYQFLPDVGDLSYRNQWIMSMFSSTIIALRPQTPLPNPRIIVKLFLVLLLKGHVSAAHALASMLNKWAVKVNITDVSSAFTLEEAIEVICDRSLSTVLQSAVKDCSFSNNEENYSGVYPGSVQIHAAVGLAWIGKGLLMRGHGKAKEIAMLLLKCLLFLDEPGSGEHIVTRSAADAFHIFLSDSEFCLNKEFHAIIRPLYKQRFSSNMIPILQSLIKDSDSSTSRAVLYRAFGHVISDAPLAAVITEAKKLVPSLLEALSALCLDIMNKDLLYGILLVLAGILMDENGKEAIIESTHTVINQLTRLVSYPNMTLVRETAIQCLIAMSGLPHTRIYPMRPQVLKAVSMALDDRKMVVRQEAVKCRQAWASIASRTLHF